jgi:hypothetical protein
MTNAYPKTIEAEGALGQTTTIVHSEEEENLVRAQQAMVEKARRDYQEHRERNPFPEPVKTTRPITWSDFVSQYLAEYLRPGAEVHDAWGDQDPDVYQRFVDLERTRAMTALFTVYLALGGELPRFSTDLQRHEFHARIQRIGGQPTLSS